jgi:hypothetical protein
MEQLNTIQPLVADLVRKCGLLGAIAILTSQQRLIFESTRRGSSRAGGSGVLSPRGRLE